MATTQTTKRKASEPGGGRPKKPTPADREMNLRMERDMKLCADFPWSKLTPSGAFCTVCGRVVVARGAGFREYFSHEETVLHKKNLVVTARPTEDETSAARRSSRLKDKPTPKPYGDSSEGDDEGDHEKPDAAVELMVYDDSSDEEDAQPASTTATLPPEPEATPPPPAPLDTTPLLTPTLAPRTIVPLDSPAQPRLLTLSKGAPTSVVKAIKKTPTKHAPKTKAKSPKSPKASPKPKIPLQSAEPAPVNLQPTPPRVKKPRKAKALRLVTPPTTSEDASGDDDLAPADDEVLPPPPLAVGPCEGCAAHAEKNAAMQKVLQALNKQTNALQEQLDSIRMLLQIAMPPATSHHV
ncbi:hypothetical protein ACHHYP_09803 [Achlya hypogyna]|uniref:Uncharacterized protein n=1 Tax=Achlya hypogyna TaxID=1202772 RepID=A0A1V9YMG8_ACHHY|nr:hypothetical protein ACHHYP_09803 [Achlya hypogyna]